MDRIMPGGWPTGGRGLIRLRLGKEADNMLRRLVFALMLVGAAFAGGAAINGPGLAWFQRNFAGGP